MPSWHTIISIIDDVCRQAAGVPQCIPSQQEPPHIQIRQQRRYGRTLCKEEDYAK